MLSAGRVIRRSWLRCTCGRCILLRVSFLHVQYFYFRCALPSRHPRYYYSWEMSFQIASAAPVPQASVAALLAAAGSPWRLPAPEELVVAIQQGRRGDSTHSNSFTFAADIRAVWADGGKAVDLSSADIVVGDPSGDATYCVVFTNAAAGDPKPSGTSRQGRVKRVLSIHGYQNLALFQQCVECAAYLNKEHSNDFDIEVCREFGYQFEKRRDARCQALGTVGAHVESYRVIVSERAATLPSTPSAVMSGEELIAMAKRETNFRLFDLPDSDSGSYLSLARQALSEFLRATGSQFVWLTFRRQDDDVLLGRVVLELFARHCPKTVANFTHLCKGDLPDVAAPDFEGRKVPLSYKGSSVFRLVQGAFLQAGDIAGSKDGTSGYSIYGRYFPDESFAVPHDVPGIVGMANDGGEHTNGSSFYVTLDRCSWMNGRYVAFGKVVEGLRVIETLSAMPTHHNQSLMQKVIIDDCGVVGPEGY